MSTKVKTQSKKIRVPSIKSMTPEKYKALSPEMRSAYNKKTKAYWDAFDKKIEAKQIEDLRRLARALVAVIAVTPGIEWDIVSNYLERNKKVITDASESTVELRAQLKSGQLQRRAKGK